MNIVHTLGLFLLIRNRRKLLLYLGDARVFCIVHFSSFLFTVDYVVRYRYLNLIDCAVVL